MLKFTTHFLVRTIRRVMHDLRERIQDLYLLLNAHCPASFLNDLRIFIPLIE